MIINTYKYAMFPLICLSNMGYSVLFFHKAINRNLIPGLLVCCIIVIEFVGGILNVLPFITLCLFSFGLFLFAKYIIREGGHCFKDYFHDNPSAYIVAFFTIYAFFLFRDSVLTGYDDFSHWGTVAKCIIVNDRLPRFSDSVITFQSYPPGTGLLIYYFSKIVSAGESSFLFSQFLAKVAFISSLYCFEDKSSNYSLWCSRSVITLMSVIFIIYNVPSFSLSVDNILGCCGVYCFSSVYVNRDHYKKALFFLVISSTACILIKNSGVFFWLTGLSFLFVYVFQKDAKQQVLWNMIAVFIPVFMLYLWQRHVEYAFLNGLNSKHTMTFSHGLALIKNKSKEELINEVRFIITLIVNPKRNRAIILLLGDLIIVLRSYRSKKKIIFDYIYICVVFLVYQLGIIAMYLFSMPHSEIIYQKGADYNRYNGTLVVYIAALSLILIINSRTSIHKHSKIKPKDSDSLIAIMLIVLALFPRIHFQDLDPATKTSIYYADKINIKTTIQNHLYNIYPDDNSPILVRVDEKSNEAGYVYYMMRYLLLNDCFGITTITDNEVFYQFWEDNDYAYCIDAINDTLLKKQDIMD